MRIAYIQDQTITEFKGEFFHSKSIRFFSKFLSGFNETDTLEVYCPFDYANEESVVKRYQNIYNPQIHYHSIPLCKKISNYMKIKNAVTDAVSKSDLCYLRVGIAGYFASKVCKKQGKKYVAIVNEDLYQNTKVHRKIIVRLSSLPLKYMARMAATICPIIVAVAAPATPISGKNPIPKIKSGSRIMLITAPVPWVIIV